LRFSPPYFSSFFKLEWDLVRSTLSRLLFLIENSKLCMVCSPQCFYLTLCWQSLLLELGYLWEDISKSQNMRNKNSMNQSMKSNLNCNQWFLEPKELMRNKTNDHDLNWLIRAVHSMIQCAQRQESSIKQVNFARLKSKLKK